MRQINALERAPLLGRGRRHCWGQWQTPASIGMTQQTVLLRPMSAGIAPDVAVKMIVAGPTTMDGGAMDGSMAAVDDGS